MESGGLSGDTAGRMSQANVETIRTALRALDRRDVELYLSVASPEIELITPAAPLEGANVGHEGIRRFFQELEKSAESSSFEVREVRAVGERVVAFSLGSRRSNHSATAPAKNVEYIAFR